MAKKKRKKRLSHQTPEERRQSQLVRRFKQEIRYTFLNSGFLQIPSRNHSIVVDGRKSDFDSIFIYDNIVVMVEDTTLRDVSDHLRKKKEYVAHLQGREEELIEVLCEKLPEFDDFFNNCDYHASEIEFCHVYCSLNAVPKRLKTRYAEYYQFLDYAYLKYFLALSKSIRLTARHELFKFLGFEITEIGTSTSADNWVEYKGLLLPEAQSGFPKGHRLVSFLVDPATLLEQAYVLRADSWRDSECLYQRLLIKTKLTSMRKYLVELKRVFVNNIIVTLPDDTKIHRFNGGGVPARVRQIVPVKLSLPRKYNSIGIIDGQHRVYSYHEGQDEYDKAIGVLRGKQHLLVTGIVYPADTITSKKQEFEARLFLEINDKQKRVKSDLRQSIEMLVDPYSPVAIAKAVVAALSQDGPLTGLLETHFYDVGKIKTASIVSYGMRHIVGMESENSFFKLWRNKEKKKVTKQQSKKGLENYVGYCTKQLNIYLSGFKANVDKELWTTDRKKSRVLNTTTINGLIYCMRLLIRDRALGDYETYKASFASLCVKFTPEKYGFKSSNWKDLGEQIYRECFDS